jgi:hypothetical protein
MSAGLVAGSDLTLMGSKGCEDFSLFALRDLEVVEGSSKFRCDLIELRGRDPELPVRLFKAKRRLARFSGRELERSTRNVAAWTLSKGANMATGAALSARAATRLRLVMEVEAQRAMIYLPITAVVDKSLYAFPVDWVPTAGARREHAVVGMPKSAGVDYPPH